jgi:[ribosomal protein S5]-alanine N-acetyltransferase
MVIRLETERLLLEPLSSACEAMYSHFYTNADASKSYGGPLTKAAALARLNTDLSSWELSGFGVWAIRHKQDGVLVGVCGFWQGKGWPRELTWWLLPEARGQGLAQESSLAAVAHAYNSFKWDVVETYMNDDNIAARTLVERLGGVIINRAKFPDGLMRNIYTIAKPL